MVSQSDYFGSIGTSNGVRRKIAPFEPCAEARALADVPDVEIRAAIARQSRAPLQKVKVGGLPVAVLTRFETALLTLGSAIDARGRGAPCRFFTTVNGQVISLCASSPRVRALYAEADVLSPDGMSVVITSRLRCGTSLPERVATTDAFHDAAAIAERVGARFYFLGADETTCRIAVERAKLLYPGLDIVGHHSGYFAESDEPELVARINDCAPDILWIGMGVPRQQAFVVRNREALTQVGVAKTCGGLFDFLAGKISRAPDWMQRSGLEWLYRAILEPTRLGPRYLSTNPHAFYHLVRNSGHWNGP